MTDESTPDALPAPGFPSALRGYDRVAVDDHIRKLHAHLVDVEAKLDESGAADADPANREAIRRELEAVGSEVAAILEAARTAAENMRARAAEDAGRWRADADRQSRELLESSEKAAQSARGDAWETGTDMLEQATHEAAALLESARQDALYIRAEAEREAVRLTGDARRDAEEAVRAGRGEAEQLAANAQAEAQTTLDNARRSAELAQERARALERRRGELMEELELARRSIGEIEEGQTATAAPPPTEARPPGGGTAEPLPAEKPPSDWPETDASVRIVPAIQLPPEMPVDTDSFVAEVEQLRATPPPAPEPALEAEGEWLDVLEGDDAGADEAGTEEPAVVDPDSSGEAVAPEPQPVVDSAPNTAEVQPPPAAGAAVDVVVDLEAPEAVEEVELGEPAAEEATGEIDDLFATLRRPGPVPAAEPAEVEPARVDEAAAAVVTGVDSVPAAQDDQEIAVESAAVVDPFDLKERMLLPIENRALRSVKRRIVDLQNRVLEELRVGDADWQPDRALFAASFGDEVVMLTQESYVAGYAAAAELVGEAATPPPDRAADQEATTEFVDAALAATSEALERARATGGGARQVSASVSRVFRAWRTDEAERRLRQLGAKAYHAGIVDALPGLGVTRVAAITEGTPCGSCPAGTTATWRPADELPAGTAMPPAVPGCTATIVPVATG